MARSPSRTLQLTYLGDASQLNRVTAGAGQNVQGFGDRLKTFGKVAAGAFLAVGAGAVKLGQTLFEAFEEASTANARIENLVGVMGNFEGQVDGVTQRLIEQAEATARLTGVDRNLIKESQGILLTFANVNKTAGDAGSTFDRATQAAVDLAAAGFGSVDSAANQLGKALEDPVRGLGSLREVGVSFTAEQEELIRSLAESNNVLGAQTLILEAIEGQVGGTAEATANGSDRIRQSFGLLTESVAEQLSPAFEFLVEKALEFVDDFGEWWKVNGPDIIQSFRDFGVAVRDTYTEFRDFTDLVDDELRERGAYARLQIAWNDLKLQFEDTLEAWDRFTDAIFGPSTEEKATSFASIIDRFVIEPYREVIRTIDFALEKLEEFLDLATRVANVVKRVQDSGPIEGPVDFFSRLAGAISAEQASPLSTPPPDFSGSAGRRQTGNVTVNITGAIDPESTARQVDRILNDSGRRAGPLTAVAGGFGGVF